ncbi:hypothetical protein [Pseudalkalibacillus salsuginis]|uniref:hypothetical protein n=1 Tax=Pseudalkalibacillus salsuginis TaxID=2910972 RepID=UPI001F1C34D9|nr:hypothetical protein [Pseudalkalibacillus salsuginis]MCF6409912.1 hypothetical protein [Pseudalkalibacillus salsuginis]
MPRQIIHIDDHIVERKKRYDTGKEEWKEYFDFVAYLNCPRNKQFHRESAAS